MARLDNARYELYAQAIARGVSQSIAYAQAGFKPNPANAGRLKNRTEVRQRIAELLEAQQAQVGLNIDSALSELRALAFSDIRKVLIWRGAVLDSVVEDGVARQILRSDNFLSVIDSDKISRAEAAAIAEVSQTREGIKVKLHPKLPALALLVEKLEQIEAAKGRPLALPPPGEKALDFKLVAERYALHAKPDPKPEDDGA